MVDPSTALYEHILSQTRQNVQFLRDQNQISQPDADHILERLVLQAPLVNVAPSIPAPEPVPSMPAMPAMPRQPSSNLAHRLPPPPPPPAAKRVKALWDYNVNNEDPNDLTFHAGDMIELVSKTNDDWWTGKLHGRQGLFPSNYVEEVAPTPAARAPSPNPPYQYSEKPQAGFAPPPPHGGYGGPPPMGYHHAPPPGQMMAPPPPQGPVVIEVAQPKKSRFGGNLGNTLAHSAAGGVGFGAGSAIGSGIIHSIF